MAETNLDIIINGVDNASDTLNNVGSSANSLGKNFDKLAAGAIAGLGAAIVGTGIHAANLAGEIENATAKATTQLDLSAEEAANFENVMRSIYRNNFGEGYEDIAESLAVVNQQFERIGGTQNEQQLQTVTEQAFALRDAFGVDVAESVNAATTLMDKFGLTSDEAFGFIAAGFQRGLNSSGDFLDSVGEYSGQFSDAGFNADQFFSTLETGLEGGVLGTDKIADAFKEFNIRIQDDSTTTKDALDAIGISYEELRAGFADGSITQADAMQMVIDKLNEIEDPIERNKAGVALFGTQWEDVTDSVILNIDSQKTSMSELENSITSLDDQYQTATAEWQTVTRNWKDALADVGDVLRDLGTVILPVISDFMTNSVVPAINSITEDLREIQDMGFWEWLTKDAADPTDRENWKRFFSLPPQWQRNNNNDNFSGPSGVTINQAFYGNADAAMQAQIANDTARALGITP